MRIKPKKRLGQNFLTDKNIQKKIIASLALGPSDIVLEIGAGSGALTGLIASRVKKVYAVEIDSGLCSILQDNLSGYANVEIINQDILKLDLTKKAKKGDGSIFYSGKKAEKIEPSPFFNDGPKLKVIGNIPYYISSPIIEYLFKYKDTVSEIFLALQKEFAMRLCAWPGTKNYGSFSCFTQYYAEPKILFEIKKNCFFPVPKVDSSFVKLTIRNQPPVFPKDEEMFFKIIRAAFNQRRKVLKNSLEGLVKKESLKEFFAQYSLSINTRPEELSLEDFSNLTYYINT